MVYEPEAFPGLILKAEECTFNVFASVKFLILGCTDVRNRPRDARDSSKMCEIGRVSTDS